MLRNLHLPLLWALIPLFSYACSLVEVEQPQEEGGASSSLVKGPRSISAGSAQDFAAQLHGEASKTWSNVSFEMDGVENLLECRLDDQMTLYADGTYAYNAGQKLCGGDDINQSRIGIYRIDFAAKELIFDEGSNLEAKASVIGLTANEVVLTSSYLLLEVRGHYKSE